MKKIQLALIGAGNRGMYGYAKYAKLNGIVFTAVAEPDEKRRARFCKEYNISPENTFFRWQDLLDRPKLADGVIIATQDNMHFQPAAEAIKKGYAVLLEKPISPDPEECLTLQALAEDHKTEIMVCHVLRYTPFFRRLKSLLDSGIIGDVASVTLTESVQYGHYGHSFVRGNWRNAELSSPMILAKSCHDMDLLTWLLNSPCVNVSSMGSLKHFKAENAPPGAPERCLDGCPVQGECPWYAPAFYMDGIPPDQWPAMVLGENLDEAGVERALKEGPYGRCVYRTDNNVVDHQQVLLLFENGVTASFTMCAFTARGGRDIRFMGTKGEIHGQLDNGIIEVSIFTQGRSRRPVTTYDVGTVTGGHNGGDSKIIADFAAILRGELINTNTIAQSVHGHIMAFAAEEARLTGKVIPLAEYTGKLERHL